MNPTIVYRVENKIGLGMYTGEKNLNRCPEYIWDGQIKFHHPIPHGDLLNASQENGALFGFESLETLYTWLYDINWIIWLRNNGYTIIKFTAEKIIKKDSVQLVFDDYEILSKAALSIYGPAKFIKG